MRYLVTGGCGFIGSHFVEHLRQKQPDSQIEVYDSLTYAGDLSNIESVEKIEVKVADILDKDELRESINKADVIVNFAAETHVDNSIKNSKSFVETNIVGVNNILELIKGTKKRFLQISTDEVYGPIREGLFADEKHPLNPSNPYASSKAAADLLVLSYRRTFGVDALITRSCNNFGPRQNKEKFIPKVIYCIKNSKPIPLYDGGVQVREWIYVKDNCKAIYSVLQSSLFEFVYNIGSSARFRNIEIINKISAFMKKPAIIECSTRPGHDFRYALSSSKLSSIYGLLAEDFDEKLKELIEIGLEEE